MLSKETQDVFVRLIMSRVFKESPLFTNEASMRKYVDDCLQLLGTEYDKEDAKAIGDRVVVMLESLDKATSADYEKGTPEDVIDDEPEKILEDIIEDLEQKLNNIGEELDEDLFGIMEDAIAATTKNIEDGKLDEEDPKVVKFHKYLYLLDLIDQAIEEFNGIVTGTE